MSPPEKTSGRLEDFVGIWTGMGWGTEVRFRETRRGFARKMAQSHGRRGNTTKSAIYKTLGGGARDGVLMSLTVEHTTRFAFSVDEHGNVRGQGVIEYHLYPNLCGVAALTRIVNQTIDLLSYLPKVYELGTELGLAFAKKSNATWLAEEARMQAVVDDFQKMSATRRRPEWATVRRKEYRVAIEDADDLARAITANVCQNQKSFTVIGGLDCVTMNTLVGGPNLRRLREAKSVHDALKEAAKPLWSDLKKNGLHRLNDLVRDHRRIEAMCPFPEHAAVIDTAVGPDLETMLLETAKKVPALAQQLIVDKEFPHDFLMNIPGMTKVQYSYKGMPRGAESRIYDIEGKLVMTSAGPRLSLVMKNLRGGSRDLPVEYQVNYKTERSRFPAWSPFLDGRGVVRKAGVTTTYERTKETVSRKVRTLEGFETASFERHRTVARPSQVQSPFATFYEEGKQRNGVKVWHDYQYFWSAYKLLQPPDGLRGAHDVELE